MMENDENKLKILTKSEELFMQYGYSKVTVDEIAQALGMSKKTLYAHFRSKEDILTTLLEQVKTKLSAAIKPIIDDANLTGLEKMNRLMPILAAQISKMKSNFAEDLMRCCPHIWNALLKFRKEHILEHFGKLIRQGISKGLIQQNIDERLIVHIYISIIEGVLNPTLLSQISHSGEEVYRIILQTFFFGILTDEGRRCCPTVTELNNNRTLNFGAIQ